MSPDPVLDPIQRIRRFYRAVSRESGALDSSFLGRGRPLGLARVLWSIPRFDGDLAAIRADMGSDSGLFSRSLRTLETEGLISLSPHPTDKRRRTARLTPKGRAEVALYDDLSNTRAARLLGPSPDALLDAMDLIASMLNRDHVQITAADPDDPAVTYCWGEYFALLVAKIPGLDVSLFPLPDPHAAAYRPPHGALFVARSDTMPIACAALRPLDGTVAEVKRLWVAPHARGQGLARRMMQTIEDQARALGYTSLKLDTHAALTGAITLYERSGWTPIPAYSGPPSTHWFAKPL